MRSRSVVLVSRSESVAAPPPPSSWETSAGEAMREVVMWNPSFTSWYVERRLMARSGTKRTFLNFTSRPPARRLSGMSGQVGQGIGPVLLSFRGWSNGLKLFRPSFNLGRVNSLRLLQS